MKRKRLYISKYVLKKEFENGDLLLWNLVNSKVIIFCNGEKEKLLNGHYYELKDLNYMIENNFLKTKKNCPASTNLQKR